MVTSRLIGTAGVPCGQWSDSRVQKTPAPITAAGTPAAVSRDRTLSSADSPLVVPGDRRSNPSRREIGTRPSLSRSTVWTWRSRASWICSKSAACSYVHAVSSPTWGSAPAAVGTNSGRVTCQYAAYAAIVSSQVLIINVEIGELGQVVADHPGRHRDAERYLSLPGTGAPVDQGCGRRGGPPHLILISRLTYP